MATFKYTAKDANAKTVVGKISADNQTLVLEELRKRKLIVISIEAVKESSFSKISLGGKKGVKPEDLVIFARQLATMVDSGIPILQGLDALQEQITHLYFKSVIVAIRDDIQLGSSLELDSEFYQLERKLTELIGARRPDETLSDWLERAATDPSLAETKGLLTGILRLHYRHRFDPQGLSPTDRVTLKQTVKECLESMVAAKSISAM